MMIQRVIVAYDGSELAKEAFTEGMALARRIGARVVGVYVLEINVEAVMAANPGLALDPMMPPVAMPTMAVDEGEEREQARREMEVLRGQAGAAGVAFEPRIERGSLVDWLVNESGPETLIALGMRGRFASAGVGSTTRSLVKHSRGPVMVVSGKAAEPGRVVALFDGTESSERAARVAGEMADAAKLPLVVVAAHRSDQTAEAAAARAHELMPGAEVVALPEATEGAKQEAALVERVASAEAGTVVVMGAFADSWIRDLFFGSTTEQVLRLVNAPVVLVH